MAHIVTLSNGEEVEFPDEMSDEQIQSTLKKKYQSANVPMEDNALISSANSPGINAILGAGDALRNLLGNTISTSSRFAPESLKNLTALLSGQTGSTSDYAKTLMMGNAPGLKIPEVKSGEGLSYDVGNLAGNIGAFIGGGEGAESVNLLSKLSPLAKRLIGSSAFGAAQDQENPLKGAAEGAAFQGAAEALPIVAKPISKLADLINVDKYAKQLEDYLTGGVGFEEGRKSLAQNINKSYSSIKDEMSSKYENFMKKWGNYPLNFKGNKYSQLPKEIYDTSLEDIDSMHQGYLEKPTISKAHKLQSEIGKEKAFYEKKFDNNTITPDERRIYNDLVKRDDALNNDIEEFFNKRNIPDKYLPYQEATDFARENYYPFYQDKRLAQIALGKTKNPTESEIRSIFASPEPSMQKIADSLGDVGKGQILGVHLSPNVEKKTSEDILNGILGVDRSGMNYYKTPEFNELEKELLKRTKYSKLPVMASKYIPYDSLVKNIESVLQKSYSPIKKAASPFALTLTKLLGGQDNGS
jgi:hypothetical protein